jgi:hypothetical protein
MANLEPNLSVLPEKRIDLAIQAVKASQLPNLQVAAHLYNVSYTILYNRFHGRITRQNAQINNRKLTTTEEKALLQRVKFLDNNGFSPTLPFVRKMANQLLKQRLPTGSVGKNWL